MAKFDLNNLASNGETVDIDVEGDTALITFGASFTLRLDEENIDILRSQLYEASRRLAINASQALRAEGV
jgi:hypothetical protein|tara:strand:- start:779 stop:988 length:210 start_codon:yes stop_codon:yes gene_type:complete